MNYPTSLDNTTSLPNPSGTDKQNSPDHGALHTAENQAIIALEQKLGIGSTTPSSTGLLLIPTGAGTTAWTQVTSAQLAASISDETGTGSTVFANTPTLITPKVDAIQEATTGNGVTVGGVNMKSGAITTTSVISTASLQDSAITSAKVATGIPVQIVSANFGNVLTGTTRIPVDDTIPQNTEGDQYMSLSITPKSATNHLLIEARMMLADTATNPYVAAALFQDSGVSAVAANVQQTTANSPVTIILQYDMVAGTTSSTVFKVRGGGFSAGTTTFNGQAGGRFFGGATVSTMKITEYKA